MPRCLLLDLREVHRKVRLSYKYRGEVPLGDSVVYSTFATAAAATKVFPMSKVVLVRRSHSLPLQPFLCFAECGENLRPHCPNDRRAHSIAQLLVAVGGGDLVSRRREFEIVVKAHLCNYNH